MKTSKEKIELMYSLYLEGNSYKEIGKILEINANTVSILLRKEYSIKTREKSRNNIDQKKFEELWHLGKSDSEIATFFGVKESTVSHFRTHGVNKGKFKTKKNFSDEDHKLSIIQEQMIFGSLLGDMNLSNPISNRSINSRLAIVHCEEQEELFMKKIEILDIFMGSYRLYSAPPDKRTGNIYKSFRGNSKSHKVFTDIFKIVYPDNKKRITVEFLEKIYHPIALAYWFMDDGTNTGTIATNSFSKEEIDLLINWLKNQFNIESTRQKNQDNEVIHISSKCRKHFEELIHPYIIESMKYKLQYY